MPLRTRLRQLLSPRVRPAEVLLCHCSDVPLPAPSLPGYAEKTPHDHIDSKIRRNYNHNNRMLGRELALILSRLGKFLKSYSRRSQWSICRF